MTVARILDKKGYKVFTVPGTTPLREVVRELVEREIGALVVTGPGGEAAGIVSERDVIRALATDFEGRKAVADVMTGTLVKCSLDDTEGEVMERMGKARVRHLPVLHHGKLVGIVSARDLLDLRIEKLNEMMADIRSEAARMASPARV